MPTAHLSLLAAARPGSAPSVHILLGAGPAHDEAVRTLLAALAPGARILRAGNPLRSPLTIERILLQGGQEEIGLLPDDAAEEAMQRLCARRSGESRVVLVIEQAETLGGSAVRILSRLVAPGGRPQAGMDAHLHVVFVGLPSFKGLIRDRAAAPIRDALISQGGPALEVDSPAPSPAAMLAQAEILPVVSLAPALVTHGPAPRAARSAPLFWSGAAQALLVLAVLSGLAVGAIAALPTVLDWVLAS